MKYLVALFVVLCLLACKQRKHIDCIRPYTVKEQVLMDSITNEGQSVNIFRFNYPYMGDSIDICLRHIVSDYDFFVQDIDSAYANNLDSMRIISKRMAAILYNNIIEDSVLMYTDRIWLNFDGKKYNRKKKNVGPCGAVYSVKFEKKDLENYFGFKVVETKNVISRVKINQKKDTLIFTDEDHYQCNW